MSSDLVNELVLKPQQVSHFSNIKSKLQKYSFCIDISPLGSGKTYVSAILSRDYEKTYVISTPNVLTKWKQMKTDHKLNVELYTFRKASDIHLEPGCLVIIDEFHNFKNPSKQTIAFTGMLDDFSLSGGDLDSVHMLCLSSTPFDKKSHVQNITKVMGLYRLDLSWYCKSTQQWYFYGYHQFITNLTNKNIINDTDKKNLLFPSRKNLEHNMFVLFECIKKKVSVKMQNIDNGYKCDITDVFKDTVKGFGPLEDMKNLVIKVRKNQIDGGQVMTKISSICLDLEFYKTEDYIKDILKAYRDNPKHKIVMLLNYHKSINFVSKLLEKLGISYFCITGNTPKNIMSEYLKEFQSDTLHKRFLIGNLKVLSTGIDLDDKFGNRKRIVYVSPSFNSIDLYQSMARFHRFDTKSDSVVYIMYIKYIDLSEERLINNLKQKFRILYTITD
jgi:superfamily II DNA or RNA helicase